MLEKFLFVLFIISILGSIFCGVKLLLTILYGKFVMKTQSYYMIFKERAVEAYVKVRNKYVFYLALSLASLYILW